jgi:hypothetical protein
MEPWSQGVLCFSEAVYVLLVSKTTSARQPNRHESPHLFIVATLIIAFEMVAHVFSLATLLVLAAEAPAILLVEAVAFLFELIVLWLLWFSRSSRAYFAMGKRRAS